uniref:Uncharacterized protein n=1 Tax=Anguilla anguilla TaxID=7936 RepID=A0A0E9PH74_ANGAN
MPKGNYKEIFLF